MAFSWAWAFNLSVILNVLVLTTTTSGGGLCALFFRCMIIFELTSSKAKTLANEIKMASTPRPSCAIRDRTRPPAFLKSLLSLDRRTVSQHCKARLAKNLPHQSTHNPKSDHANGWFTTRVRASLPLFFHTVLIIPKNPKGHKKTHKALHFGPEGYCFDGKIVCKAQCTLGYRPRALADG